MEKSTLRKWSLDLGFTAAPKYDIHELSTQFQAYISI